MSSPGVTKTPAWHSQVPENVKPGVNNTKTQEWDSQASFQCALLINKLKKGERDNVSRLMKL